MISNVSARPGSSLLIFTEEDAKVAMPTSGSMAVFTVGLLLQTVVMILLKNNGIDSKYFLSVVIPE